MNKLVRAALVIAGLGAVVVLTGVIAALCLPTTARSQPALPQPLRPVPGLDVDRYLGRWHQLAAIPAPFSLACARDTTAEYGLLPSGDVSVHNTCTTWANTPNSITGSARVLDPVTKAQLQVSFPFGSPDQPGVPNYVVTAIAPDYSWALVGDPLRVSGFLLSRTPAFTAEQWQIARAAIAGAGYNGCVFLTSPTTGGRGDIAPLCYQG